MGLREVMRKSVLEWNVCHLGSEGGGNLIVPWQRGKIASVPVSSTPKENEKSAPCFLPSQTFEKLKSILLTMWKDWPSFTCPWINPNCPSLSMKWQLRGKKEEKYSNLKTAGLPPPLSLLLSRVAKLPRKCPLLLKSQWHVAVWDA